jgi:hypothetical protein
MMNPMKQKREEGDKILNNYKKQIAEKMAREKAERGEALSSKSGTNKNKNTKGSKNFDDDYGGGGNFGSRMGEMGMNEPPEPEVLLSILNRRTKK